MFASRKLKIILTAIAGGVMLNYWIVLRLINWNMTLDTLLNLCGYALLALSLLFRAMGRKRPALILAIAFAGVLLLIEPLSALLRGYSFAWTFYLFYVVKAAAAAGAILYSINLRDAEHRWLWLILGAALLLILVIGSSLDRVRFYVQYDTPVQWGPILLSALKMLCYWQPLIPGLWPLRRETGTNIDQ